MLEKMRIFTKVVELQGFRKAAKNLGISTPVVTKRINELEAELATKLLQRSTRTLSITEAGQLFYEKSKEMLSTMETTRSAIRSLKTEVSGTIKIGLASAIIHSYVTPALPKLLKQYPNIQIEIMQGNHLLSLLDNHFDLVMYCGDLPDSNFHYKKIGEWEKITCASPNYFRKHGKPKSPSELIEHNCLDHSDNLQNTWRYLVNSKPHDQRISGSVKINNSTNLKQLALSHVGIIYSPSFVIQQELEKKLLIRVLEKFEPKPLGMYLVYPSNQFISKKTALIINFIERLLAPVLLGSALQAGNMSLNEK